MKYRIERISNGWLLYEIEGEKNTGHHAFKTKKELFAFLNEIITE